MEFQFDLILSRALEGLEQPNSKEIEKARIKRLIASSSLPHVYQCIDLNKQTSADFFFRFHLGSVLIYIRRFFDEGSSFALGPKSTVYSSKAESRFAGNSRNLLTLIGVPETAEVRHPDSHNSFASKELIVAAFNRHPDVMTAVSFRSFNSLIQRLFELEDKDHIIAFLDYLDEYQPDLYNKVVTHYLEESEKKQK